VQPGPAGLSQLLLAADLVVCSAGRTANEAAAVGAPAVTLAAL
jgi:spore coat polysaccharide biosynthesis predicted glycosyltransferase SpsG